MLRPPLRRRIVLMGTLCLVAVVSCGWAQDVPSSPQAHDLIARVAPRLVRELHTRGLSYGAPIFLRLFKASQELELWVHARPQFRRFRV